MTERNVDMAFHLFLKKKCEEEKDKIDSFMIVRPSLCSVERDGLPSGQLEFEPYLRLAGPTHRSSG